MEGVDGDVVSFGGRCDNFSVREVNIYMCFWEGCEKVEGKEEVGDVMGVGWWNIVFDEVVINGILVGNGFSNEIWVVCDCCISIGDLYGVVVCYGF